MGTRLAILVGIAGLVWISLVHSEWQTGFMFDGNQPDYYNLLVDGFRDGNASMKLKPDPALWSTVPEIRSKAAYVLDASLFEKKYYLYNGVLPAVAILLPFTILAGTDMPLNLATCLFVAGGFCLSAAAYLAARRRYFPGIGAFANFAALTLLAFGSIGPVVARISGHYEVCVAAAYFCGAGMLYSLFRMLHSTAAATAWLGVGSVFAGLAVGSRPNLILVLPVVAVAVVAAARALPGRREARWWRQAAAAALLPAMAVGAALAAHNYARFGSPLEFGFKYQLNGFSGGPWKFASATFAQYNLLWYYLTPPAFSIQFPYVFPINAGPFPPGYYGFEAIDGQFPVTVLAGFTMAGVLAGRRRQSWPPSLRGFVAVAFLTFAISCAFMVSLTFRADRYMADFQAPLVLLLAIVGGVVSAGLGRGFPGRLWTGGFAVLSLAGAFHGLFGAIQHYGLFEATRRPEYDTLSRLGNRPADALRKAGLLEYGPVRLSLTFFSSESSALEPIVATGTPGATDIVYFAHYAGNRGQFVVVHEGAVGFRSPVLDLTPGRVYQLDVDMGSLYPPASFSAFDGMSAAEVAVMKQTVRLTLDGKEVMRGSVKPYESSPGWVSFGENRANGGTRYSGRILSVARLPWRTVADLTPPPEYGAWRLEIEYPWLGLDSAHPILASGLNGAGNLLFVQGLGPNTVRFGMDQWGASLEWSPPLEITRNGAHLLEIFVGSQVARQSRPEAWNVDPQAIARLSSSVRVWWDGNPIWTVPLFAHKESYGTVAIGTNPQGFSSADVVFPGNLQRLPLPPDELRDLILRNVRE